jgi:signal peptidase I
MPRGTQALLRIVLLLVAQLALTSGLRRDIVENVTMVDGAMVPTLETGDYLVVDKTAYGLRLPFSQTRLGERRALPGQLIAFDDPQAPDVLAVGRLVARAPSTYALAAGELLIDGKALPQRALTGACSYREVDADRREWVTRECARREETHGGVTYHVIVPAEIAQRTSLDPHTLPEGTVLVAMDNRRGTPLRVVREEAIRGRLTMVWLSTAGPDGLRWQRTGLEPR